MVQDARGDRDELAGFIAEMGMRHSLRHVERCLSASLKSAGSTCPAIAIFVSRSMRSERSIVGAKLKQCRNSVPLILGSCLID